MYFIPAGILIKAYARPEFWNLIHDSAGAYGALTWAGLCRNLVGVTLGNTLGGSVMVGLVYWFIYLRRASRVA